MSTKDPSGNIATPHAAEGHKSHAEEEVLAVSGALTGAVTGSVAGPPGAIAGAVIGAALGAVVGYTLDKEGLRRDRHDAALDDEIGVTEGDLGAAQPGLPQPVVGAYSSASSGAAGVGPVASEGPIQNVED